MIGMFRRGESVDIFCTELYEVSTVGYVTLKVWHFDGTNIIEDLPETQMTKHENGRWFHRHTVALDAQYGSYHVIFTAYHSAGAAVTTDDFQVWRGISAPQGEGLRTYSDSVIDPEGAPIINVQVCAYFSSDLTLKLAEDFTNSIGVFTLYLDPGTYIIRYVKAGYTPRNIELVVV